MDSTNGYGATVPRTADPAERRRAISAAFQDQLCAGGPSAATYVTVAASAGVSVGTIQHYFTARDALVRFVLEDVLAARELRVQALVTRLETDGCPLRRIVAEALSELLPLDAVRRREYLVVQHLRAEASTNADLGPLLRAGDEHLHRRVRDAVANGTRCGEVEDAVDTGTAAALILATTVGLAQMLASAALAGASAGTPVIGPAAVPASATVLDPSAVLDPVLDLVFTGRCHHYD